MAKNTRQVTQYEVYTLYAIVSTVLGRDKDNKDIVREDRRPIAVFDDRDLLDTFVAKNNDKLAGQIGYSHTMDWVEIEPSQSTTSWPFNPSPEEPVEEADTSA